MIHMYKLSLQTIMVMEATCKSFIMWWFNFGGSGKKLKVLHGKFDSCVPVLVF